MSNTKGFAVYSKGEALREFDFNRRELNSNDVKIDILYCGVCHSDLHVVNDDWGISSYPVVPGHEIIGRVVELGSDVKGFELGELVGVGCMVDSCTDCDHCHKDLEQYCLNGWTMTYGSEDKHMPGSITQGGYSTQVVVRDHFVLHVSEKLDIKGVAPLLCAGITTYSPLKYFNVQKGQKVGVVGLGGLGHLAVKLAAAMGAYVVMITTSESKGADAKRLGAHEVLVSKDPEQMAKHIDSFDLILNTIPVKHNLDPYIPLMKFETSMVMLGLPQTEVNTFPMMGRKSITGSLIGGIKETQEMLDFCAEHNIVADIELINMQDINEAYQRMQKSDIKYRFVIDMASLKK
ncbi:MAG: NAD(P)-dependent alcohol dehydrogenase [Psittacicella sp.]